MEGIKLVIGLGNPGPDYEHTRHNAGAWFIHQIAHQHRVQLRPEPKLMGLQAKCPENQTPFSLFIPTTFMNHSGRAVKAISHFYQIVPEEILIVHDEIDLAPGIARIKFAGGHGGHNGLRDIIRELGTPNFHRLRLGVGHPGNSHDVVNYVLNPPRKAERLEIDFALQAAESVLPLLLAGEIQKAMQALHTEK